MTRSRILKEVHDTALELNKAGVLTNITMRNYDKLCIAPIHDFTAREIKRLRESIMLSQTVFAAVLNTKPTTVQKWEIGQKKPSGTALKLLNIIESKGLDSVL